MRDMGWKWSQATVWSVESGKRPLRLAEAQDVASILEVPLDRLTSSMSPADAHARAAASALRNRCDHLVSALQDFRKAREQVDYLIEMGTMISPRYRETLAEARERFTLEWALEYDEGASHGEHPEA